MEVADDQAHVPLGGRLGQDQQWDRQQAAHVHTEVPDDRLALNGLQLTDEQRPDHDGEPSDQDEHDRAAARAQSPPRNER